MAASERGFVIYDLTENIHDFANLIKWIFSEIVRKLFTEQIVNAASFELKIKVFRELCQKVMYKFTGKHQTGITVEVVQDRFVVPG